MSYNEFIKSFIPQIHGSNEWLYRKNKIFVSVCFISAFYALLYLPSAIYEDYYGAVKIQVIFILFNISFPFFLKKNIPLTVLGNLWIITFGCALSAIMFISGGVFHTSTDPQLMVMMPMMALLFLNFRYAIFWIVAAILLVAVFGILQLNGHEFYHHMNQKYIQGQNLLAVIGHIFLVFMVINVFEKQKNEALNRLSEKSDLIAKEKKRSDDLLLNILPSSIIDELIKTGHSKAKLFTHVTVLFTDFVNFTQISETMSPVELVSEIDICFKAFDEIVERNGLEKIKTIGDAYLAVCGMPLEDESHAIKTVNAGIEIMQFINARNQEGGKFQIRIGINSGPLVAGIVGVKKFAYDIWGDTVNTASRMESCGEPGKINISESTFELIKDKFICKHRGKIDAKNKGMIEMYFVNHA